MDSDRHYGADVEESERLTNDDFRKLLMTPRVTSHDSSEPSTSSFAKPKTPASSHSDANNSAALRKKKKSYYAQLKKEEDEKEKELAGKYRDRAKERREGANTADPNQTAEVSTTANYRAVAPDIDAGANLAKHRQQLIQESKFLGGDMEHTHLVKGLDYALLEKVKAEIISKEQEEEMALLEKTLDKQLVLAFTAISFSVHPLQTSEDQITFRTKLARNIFRALPKNPNRPIERNDLFIPGRMCYIVDLEENEENDTDIPTTLIRSKADCANMETMTTLSNNDIVINKLTQILTYLRQGRARDKKKKKEKGLFPNKQHHQYATNSYNNNNSKSSDKYRDSDDKYRKRDGEDKVREGKRSYFERPTEEVAANENQDGGKKLSKEEERMRKIKSKMDIDSYAECYPGMMESVDALGDSDDEADYTKMDQGNKKGPVGRWDFETQEEYSTYMSAREAMPKAAFQYGVKMADGRKTRRAGPRDDKKELDREWSKIQNIISKRKPGDDIALGNYKKGKH
ncbi:hypothetical protein HELRODRAFT_88417 [Helobdella robusta]|uniref:RED-like N-terminal domain-containing protein n=1 Tax=Helobdella robusta TaxID=6412 RepID=T1G722_HELRO|nr:hypothetical protein HELRODRAFT_88417 [Helobdella robusta]ESN93661.1 hypothetical protein HELRODRAFT_88417 [Helobdella robusta]